MASTVTLFENFVRTYDGIASHNEGTLSFVNRSAWPECQQVRAILEDFYSRYPTPECFRLKARLRDEFESAFFELFLHEVLLRHGCKVRVEPTLAHTKCVPDFCAQFADEEVIVEAAVVTDVSNKERAREARMEGLHREIDRKLSSSDFWIFLGEAAPVDVVPPSKEIIRFIREKLGGLKWELVSAELEINPHATPRWDYEGKNGFSIEISAFPKAPHLRGNSDIRTVAGNHGATRWGGSADALNKSIRDKCSKYGRPNLPFIIAVNAISKWGTGQDDIDEALFGTATETPFREAVWVGPQGPRNRRLSAVIVAKVWPWNLSAGEICLYHNPYATHPCSAQNWRIPQVAGAPPNAIRIDGLSLKQLFELD